MIVIRKKVIVGIIFLIPLCANSWLFGGDTRGVAKRKALVAAQASQKRVRAIRAVVSEEEASAEVTFTCRKRSCNSVKIPLKDLKAHYSSVHKGSKPWVCQQCNGVYSSRQNLKIHTATHSKSRGTEPMVEELDLHCDVDDCSYRCNSHKSLASHRRIHTTRYKCEYPKCGDVFWYRREFIEHQKEHRYACDRPGCKRIFDTSQAIASHKKSHSSSVIPQVIEGGADTLAGKSLSEPENAGQQKQAHGALTTLIQSTAETGVTPWAIELSEPHLEDLGTPGGEEQDLFDSFFHP